MACYYSSFVSQRSTSIGNTEESTSGEKTSRGAGIICCDEST